jgi:transposase
MMKDILGVFNLQGLDRKLKGCEIGEGKVALYFGDSCRARCPRCGRWSRRLHARGKLRAVYHGAGFKRQVWLVLRNNRYLCRRCSRPFTEVASLVGPRQRRTTEAERAILEALRGRSFKSVQEREGITYGVATRVLQRHLDPERVSWPEEGEISLGIDGHSFRGTRMVHTVTDVHSHHPLTILPDSRKESLKKFLREIPPGPKARVREVCIDMDPLLLAAAEEELPQVPVVVDHFHMIQDANRRLDEARKIEQDAVHREIPKKIFLIGQEKLSPREKMQIAEYGRRYPSLKEFHWMKEQLRRFYLLRSKSAARNRLKDLIEIAHLSDDAAMVQWGWTLKRWSPHILNFFDHRTTNAYTEGIHTKIKMIKRVSFGFRNIQIYVRKMLLCILPLTIILPWLPH